MSARVRFTPVVEFQTHRIKRGARIPMEISRRTAVTALGATVVGVAAGQALAGTAEAATAPPAKAKPKATKVKAIGYVRIPKLRHNKPVYLGTENRILNLGGHGLYIGTARPGKTGHAVTFAHRTARGGPARRFNTLRT